MVARNRTNTPELLEVSGVVLPGEKIPSTPPVDQPDHRPALGGGTRTALHSHKACEMTCAKRQTCSECTEVRREGGREGKGGTGRDKKGKGEKEEEREAGSE